MAFLARTHWMSAFACAAMCFSSACLLMESPQEGEPAVQGNYDDGDEEHRPGQPCLLCHGPDHFPLRPGQKALALAGTVYPFVNSLEDEGLEGVTVRVKDAESNDYSVQSNRTGNFMFEVDTGVSTPREKDDGVLLIPRSLIYPLTVEIESDGVVQEMESKIWRNGSCAHCHGEVPGVDSVGRVFVEEGNRPE